MTQKERILRHLKQKPITPMEALRLYGCFRLAHVIWKLRKEYPITADRSKGYATYQLGKVKPHLNATNND